MCTYQRIYSHICLRVFKHADELIHLINCLFYESKNTVVKGDYFERPQINIAQRWLNEWTNKRMDIIIWR